MSPREIPRRGGIYSLLPRRGILASDGAGPALPGSAPLFQRRAHAEAARSESGRSENDGASRECIP